MEYPSLGGVQEKVSTEVSLGKNRIFLTSLFHMFNIILPLISSLVEMKHDFQIPFGENLMVMEVVMNLNDIVAFDSKDVQTLASSLDASSLSYPGILMFKHLKITVVQNSKIGTKLQQFYFGQNVLENFHLRLLKNELRIFTLGCRTTRWPGRCLT